ncbi:hypothetical protein BX666DRAFT_1971552 [Dichotomocladium elegans]|nr:hypothetical protein BX666DRAFT_1971552 [Dichotomocladium elegans]
MANTDRKVLNALETLFSDANLQWDKIMQNHLDKGNGFVPINTLLTLTKLAPLKASAEDIKGAVQGSSRLMLNEEELAVGRLKPFVLSKKEELDDWSIYVEGLEKPYDTDAKIAELFNECVGHVSFIRIPQDASGKNRFHGYCFVEFDNKENVNKAIQLMNRYGVDASAEEEKNNPKIDVLALRVMTKADWIKYRDQYLEHQAKRKQEITELWNKYNELSRSKRRKSDEADAQDSGGNEEKAGDYPKDIIAVVSNLHPKSSKTVVKALLESSGAKIAFLNFKRGNVSCHVRFSSPEDTQKAAKFFSENRMAQSDAKDSVGVPEEQSLPAIDVLPITGMMEKLYWEQEKSNSN